MSEKNNMEKEAIAGLLASGGIAASLLFPIEQEEVVEIAEETSCFDASI